MRFSSKIDWWLPALLLGSLCLGGWELGQAESVVWYEALGIVLALVLSLSVLLNTYYEFNDTHLLIRCGPFWRSVSLADIVGVKPTRNPLASMALSLDRIALTVRNSRSILISPRDRSAFMAELRQRCPLS